MGSNRSGKASRIRSLGMLAAALAVSIPLLTPTGANAAKSNLGGGVVHGTTVFDPPGIPAAGEPCQPVSFSVEGQSASFMMNTVITGYLGAIQITGTGNTDCTSATVSGGDLTLRITGEGPTGSRVDCPVLDGGYTRIGVEVIVQLTGECVVNEFGTGLVQFVSELVFTPLPPGGGVTGPVLEANFDGAFAVVPAQS